MGRANRRSRSGLGDEHLGPRVLATEGERTGKASAAVAPLDRRVRRRRQPELRSKLGGSDRVMLDQLCAGSGPRGRRGGAPGERRGSSAPSVGCRKPPLKSASSGGSSWGSEPLGGVAVFAQRLVLPAQPFELRGVGCQPEAADAPQRAPGEQLHPLERPLGEVEQLPRACGAELGAQLVVGGRGAAQREAPVAPARAAGDLAGLEHAHAQPALGRAAARRRSR